MLGAVQYTMFSILVPAGGGDQALLVGKPFATSPTLPRQPSFHLIIHQLYCHKVITETIMYIHLKQKFCESALRLCSFY